MEEGSEMSIGDGDSDSDLEAREEMQDDDEVDEGSEELDFIPFMEGIWYRRNDSDSIILLVEAQKRVYISGKAQLEPRKGSIEVLGHILTSPTSTDTASTTGVHNALGESTWTIFSTRGHSSLLYIEGKDCGEDFEGNVYPDGFAVVILRAFENPWTSGMRNTANNGDVLVGPEIHVKNNRIHPRLATADDAQEENLRKKRLKLPKMKHFLDKFGFQLVPEKLLDKYRLFVTDPAWDEFSAKIINNRKDAGGFAMSEKICVFGGKGVGKSTFCRWLTNKFLGSGEQILYIDLDPGQTEFTPPGIISVHLVSQPLLGPNFSHLRHAEKAVFLGGVNVADFPILYLNGVIELAQFASENYSTIPWIINTMGYSSGLGVPLAISVIKIFRPSNLLQLTISNNAKCSFPFDLSSNNVSTYKAPHFLINNASLNLNQIWTHSLLYDFHRIDSVFAKSMSNQDTSDFKNTPGSNNPKSLREAMLISYFAEIIGSTSQQSLLAVVPYRMKLHDVTIGCMQSDLNWDGILRTIIGNLVALCSIPDEDALTEAQKIPDSSHPCPPESESQAEDEAQCLEEVPNHPKSFIPSCSSLKNVSFIGYGLCRGYQKKTDELLVVTPLSPEQLDNVNILICAGEVGLPVSLLFSRSQSNYISGSQLDARGKKYFIPGKKSTHSQLF